MNKLGASTLAVFSGKQHFSHCNRLHPSGVNPGVNSGGLRPANVPALKDCFMHHRSTDLRIQLLQNSARNQGRSTSSSTQVRHYSRDPSELFHICCAKMNNFQTCTRYHPTEGFAGRKEKAHSRCQCLCFGHLFLFRCAVFRTATRKSPEVSESLSLKS